MANHSDHAGMASVAAVAHTQLRPSLQSPPSTETQRSPSHAFLCRCGALAVNCPRSHDTRCKHRHSIVFVKKTNQTTKTKLQSEMTPSRDVHQHLLMLKTRRHTLFLCHFRKFYTTGQRGDNIIVLLEAASLGCAGVLPGPL